MPEHPRLLRLLPASLAIAVLFPISALAAELRVAAASSTQDALGALSREFERQRGVRVSATFASSGKLYHQLLRGAPYDVFMSADTLYPEKLESAGMTLSRRRYAKGRLVLWASRRSPVDPTRGLAVLSEARVKKVAIANPTHAPFGQAAQAVLQASAPAPRVASKLVFGENVAQAAHFAATGAAEVGVLPLSLALSPRLAGQGRHWLVPENLHPALFSEAVVLKQAQDAGVAGEFLAFCVSPEGQAVLRRFGMELAR